MTLFPTHSSRSRGLVMHKPVADGGSPVPFGMGGAPGMEGSAPAHPPRISHGYPGSLLRKHLLKAQFGAVLSGDKPT